MKSKGKATSQPPIFDFQDDSVDWFEYCDWTAEVAVPGGGTKRIPLQRSSDVTVYPPDKHTSAEWAKIATALREESRAFWFW